MKYAIGIDIGGTNTRVALINEKYKIIKREQFATNPQTPIATMNKINLVIKSFGCEVEGIGLSCPGPLDLINQSVLTPPNLLGWHHFKIAEVLKEITKLNVYLENDANLACLAEAALGAGKEFKYVQFITISTGIGTGFTIDKQLYRGAKGFAQEVANCIFIKDGPRQGNLKKGSIESIASGTAITKRAKEVGLKVEHAGDVNDLAIKGNVQAMQIMDDACEYLANLVACLYAILDPDVFVLSGSVALKIEGFIEKIEILVKSKVYDILKDNVKVVKAELDEDCGLMGAAYLVFNQI